MLRGLSGPLLDCPGAPPGQAHALGCRVVTADPLYAVPPAVLADLARAGRDAMAARMCSTPQRYPSPRHLRYDTYLRSWDRARELFTADRAAHPHRHVAAELPRLPFADGTFALTLSSYLLFAHPDRFGPDDRCRRCSNRSG